jgi:hypothetical protein
MSRGASSQPSHSSTGTVKVPHDKIAQRAYEKWVKRGKPQGTAEQDWTEAEKELKAEYARAAGPQPTRH